MDPVANSVGRIYSIIPTKVTKWLQLKLLVNILGINCLPTKGLKLINRLWYAFDLKKYLYSIKLPTFLVTSWGNIWLWHNFHSLRGVSTANILFIVLINLIALVTQSLEYNWLINNMVSKAHIVYTAALNWFETTLKPAPMYMGL